LLVRKKLVSADCPCAGALARADMAATAKHAGKMIRTKLFIEVLPVVFGSLSSTHRGGHYSGAVKREAKQAIPQRKRRCGTNRSAFFVTLRRSAGLLDRREFPIGATTAGRRAASRGYGPTV